MSHLHRQLPLVLLMITVGASTRASGRAAPSRSYAQKSSKTAHCGCPDLNKLRPAALGDGGLSADGKTRISIASYKAPSGTVLVTVSGYSDSSAAANAELERWVNLASKIIVNGWKLDAKGRVVGKRVEAFLPTKGSKDVVFAVLWTSGRYFHEISSSPVCKKAVLEAEKNIHDPE